MAKGISGQIVGIKRITSKKGAEYEVLQVVYSPNMKSLDGDAVSEVWLSADDEYFRECSVGQTCSVFAAGGRVYLLELLD